MSCNAIATTRTRVAIDLGVLREYPDLVAKVLAPIFRCAPSEISHVTPNIWYHAAYNQVTIRDAEIVTRLVLPELRRPIENALARLAGTVTQPDAIIRVEPGVVIITVELPGDGLWTGRDAGGKASAALLVARALEKQVDWWKHLALFWAEKAVGR